ncbi:hypothetical protein PVAP13_4KG166820 [Panicum virgatum]|uniref:Uncharacterized protein n=1 Tax=Panicum virgatum TaxID=38727 RepID=A0A8T0TUS9_PANVG|nr:hypothetical protein PVAP13_4KG166820 [Panicum virgatum]
MLAANSYLTVGVDESLAVAAGPLTMIAYKLSAVEPMHNIDSRLSDTAHPVFDAELLVVVDVELLTMVADRPSAAEPMHIIDNCLSEPMFDADKPSAVRCDNQTDEQFYQHPHV